LILVLALQCLVQKVVLPYLLSNKIKSQWVYGKLSSKSGSSIGLTTDSKSSSKRGQASTDEQIASKSGSKIGSSLVDKLGASNSGSKTGSKTDSKVNDSKTSSKTGSKTRSKAGDTSRAP
jgi:hypothetical protein